MGHNGNKNKMKIILTESQYQKVVFNLLDTLYGPNISFKKFNTININIFHGFFFKTNTYKC